MKRTSLIAGAALLAAAGVVWAQAPQGVTDKEVVLGTHLDLSGPLVSWGLPQRNGHLMGYEEVNAAGGVHGRRLRMVVEDNGYDAKKGVLATQKLIQQDKVFAMVGMLGTPIIPASLPIVLEAGIPHLFPGSLIRLMYEPFHKLKFAFAPPNGLTTAAGMRYFAGKKKRIAVIYQDDEFGKEIRDGSVDQAGKSGMEVVAEASYKRGDTVFSSQVARVRQGNPDLIVLGTVPRETVGVVSEARKVGWNVDFLAPNSACNDQVPALGKEAVEGTYLVCQYVPFDYSSETPAVKAWMNRYEKRFNLKPEIGAAITYDMALLVALALERSGRDVTVDKFILALESIKHWESIFGAPPITYSREQRLGTETAILTQVRGGKIVRITGALK
jgi:ABC-type branched-subunit amino acid transport system substrate-binding protein